MKFREHRGTLSESLKTVRDISPTKKAIALEVSFGSFRNVEEKDIVVKPYGPDPRIDWDTHIVVLEGYGVIGFTDGPVE